MSHFMRFFRPGFQTAVRTFATATPRTPFLVSQPLTKSLLRNKPFQSNTTCQRAFQTARQHQYRRQAFNYQTFQASQSFFRRWAARPTFYRDVLVITVAAGGTYIYCLEPVPVSGRWRFRIIPYKWEAALGKQMYEQTMQQFGRKLMSSSSREHKMVRRVMERLIPHCGLEGEEWEVHVIDDPMKNAFVIPGGKVFVFRGILDVAQDDDGLAAVLGHEIAHNVAHHAAERSSQSVPVLVGLGLLLLVGLDPGLGHFVLNLAFTLPGSRKQEEEADYIGLMMMSESCYDPRAAMALWGRMEQEEKGAPPQFLSTHPSSHNRLDKIREWLPKAQAKLEAGECGVTTTYANDFRGQLGISRW